ncbi:MAG: UbiA family prenyltransferase [bacterium]
MMQQHQPSLPEIVRAGRWLQWKIPPLLAAAYAMILVNGMALPLAARTLALSLLCIFSVAAYGHVINDIFDIPQDLAAGKKNALAGLSSLQRCLWVLLFIATGFAPLVFFDFGLTATILLIVNYLLPTLYSIPIVRLKERGFAGVIADALGAHAVPTSFMAVAVNHLTPMPSKLGLAVAISAATWALFAGLRGIIIHQIVDHRHDRQTGVVTFASGKKWKQLRAIVLKFFLPGELSGLIFFLGLVTPFAPIIPAFALIYILSETAKIKLKWKLPLFYPEHPTKEPYLPLLNNEFHEVWLPCALAAQLVFKEPGYGLIFILHVILFRPIIKERMTIFNYLLHDIIRQGRQIMT